MTTRDQEETGVGANPIMVLKIGGNEAVSYTHLTLPTN